MASLIEVVTGAGGCGRCFNGLVTSDAKDNKEKQARGVHFEDGSQKGNKSNPFDAAPPQLLGHSEDDPDDDHQANRGGKKGMQSEARVWNGEAMCGTNGQSHRAKDLLKKYTDSGQSHQAAMEAVMHSFPDSFEVDHAKASRQAPDNRVVVVKSMSGDHQSLGSLRTGGDTVQEMQARMEALEKANVKLAEDNKQLEKRASFNEDPRLHKKSRKKKDDSDEDGDTSEDEGSGGSESDVMSEEGGGDEDDEAPRGMFKRLLNIGQAKGARQSFKTKREDEVQSSSILGFNVAIQVLVYLVAAGGVLFVLIAPAFEWGKPAHRRLHDFPDYRGDLVQAARRYWYDLDDEYVLEDHAWADWRSLSEETGDTSTGHSDGNGSTTNTSGAHGSTNLGAGAGHGSSGSGSSGSDSGGHQLVINIAYCTVSAGFIGILVHLLDQPLLLGYILGGVLVGPVVLGLIKTAEEVNTISELGLILLLFMIGLELDIKELLRMGPVVLITGSIQFPICCCVHLGFFSILAAVGVSWGEGMYSTMYMAVCCSISSTMIVVKLLSQKMETDTQGGRLTIGILIFQDMWAIIVMAIQPNLASPEILGILQTFGMMLALLIIAFTYSKYVLPAVFQAASSSMELLLILSMAWCFFICCVALLPQFNLSMELAALIAGVSMATFPYSAELNGKIKYIRDYFITLYFVSLGMQIPSPTFDAIYKSLITCVVVLSVRWLGIFLVVFLLKRDDKLAVISTMNLSEVSEFGLVLCSIGKKFGHVENDTFTIMIWTFSILAVSASYFIKYNHAGYVKIHGLLNKIRKSNPDILVEEDSSHGEERDIVLLGFSKIANALISEIKDRCPMLLKRLHIIDDSMTYKLRIESKGISFSFGDIGNPDVLQHSMPHGQEHVKIVLITRPDSQLGQHTNQSLMNVLKCLPCCKEAKVVCTAERQEMVERLYAGVTNGEGQTVRANYVLKMVKLSAEKLADMLETYASGMGDDHFNVKFNEALNDLVSQDKAKVRRASEVDNVRQGSSRKGLANG